MPEHEGAGEIGSLKKKRIVALMFRCSTCGNSLEVPVKGNTFQMDIIPYCVFDAFAMYREYIWKEAK